MQTPISTRSSGHERNRTTPVDKRAEIGPAGFGVMYPPLGIGSSYRASAEGHDGRTRAPWTHSRPPAPQPRRKTSHTALLSCYPLSTTALVDEVVFASALCWVSLQNNLISGSVVSSMRSCSVCLNCSRFLGSS
jgi:hypothetical protein